MSLLDKFDLIRKRDNIELTGFEDRPVDIEKQLNLYTREGQFYVLLADADNEERVQLERMIDQTGCYVNSVSSGMECMMEVLKDKYDLIILSRNMPRMDGIQTMRNIKSTSESKCKDAHLYIILDEKVDEPDIFFENEGFDGILRKPIDKAILQNVIIGLVPDKMLPDDEDLIEDIREIAEDAETLKECDVRLIEGLKIFKGDMSQYMTTASKFCEEYAETSGDMLDALYTGKSSVYMDMARQVREASRTIGAIYLADILDDHVNMAKDDSLDVAESSWQSLIDEWEKVVGGLSSWLGKTNEVSSTTEILILKTNGIKLKSSDIKERANDMLSDLEHNKREDAEKKLSKLAEYDLEAEVRRKVDQIKRAFEKDNINIAVDILRGMV
ncbi:MAG: response regulator [Eubacterium sp.]|nr:response regulator [Eubacterium sp.]